MSGTNGYELDQRRAGATVGFICCKAGEPISVLKTLKLVYLAQRESLRRYGEPLFDEQYANTPVGPMPFMTWRGVCADGLELSHLIGLPHKISDPKKEFSVLSEGDTDVLDDIWKKFGGWEDKELASYTCSSACPEGEQVYGDPRQIGMEVMLGAVGFDPESVENVMEHLALQKKLQNTFVLGEKGHA